MRELITSVANPTIKRIKRLEKSAERRAAHLFTIEGIREIALAITAGYEITTLVICQELFERQRMLPDVAPYAEIIHKATDRLALLPCTEQVFSSLAYREGVEGLLAVAKMRTHTLNHLVLPQQPLILISERVEKPGNLGAMLRTADAGGVDAVIIADPVTDIYNPNVIRSSVGTVFTLQLAVADTETILAYLKDHGISVLAATPEAVQCHFEVDMTKATAVVVGTEALGLSPIWLSATDQQIKIPMRGKIDSLNVSASAAIILFEAVRQRMVHQ